MADFVLTKFNKRAPAWVLENIMAECPYCGSPICDNSPTGTMTFRWCLNPKCPGHMQHRIEALAKHFGISGFGVKSALSWYRLHPNCMHLEILKEWFDVPPLVPLSTVVKLAFIRGYGETSAVTALDSYADFQTYFQQASPPDPILNANRQYLYECSTYFRIKEPVSSLQMVVMGTGAFNGYKSRSDYFSEINEKYGRYVHVIETTGPRKTGVAYLIKENNAPDRSKSRIAAEYGIPVLTPKQFYDMISAACHTEIGGD